MIQVKRLGPGEWHARYLDKDGLWAETDNAYYTGWGARINARRVRREGSSRRQTRLARWH